MRRCALARMVGLSLPIVVSRHTLEVRGTLKELLVSVLSVAAFLQLSRSSVLDSSLFWIVSCVFHITFAHCCAAPFLKRLFRRCLCARSGVAVRQGAGGNGNVLKEIVDPAGATYDIRKVTQQTYISFWRLVSWLFVV